MDKTTAPLKAREEYATRLSKGLVTRLVLVECTNCRALAPSDMPWQCGYCEYENRHTGLYSFLYKCERCEREPKSYLCTPCRAANPLDPNTDLTAPARQAIPKAKPIPLPDPRLDRRVKHEDTKEQLQQEIEIAQLKAKLDAVVSGGVAKDEPANLQEQIKKELEEYVGKVLGGHMAVEEARRDFGEKYKEQPELLERINEALDRFDEDNFA